MLFRSRNFSPIMATAAKVTVVQTGTYVQCGAIDPEAVVTPGIYVHRIVTIPAPTHEAALVQAGAVYS